MTGTVQLLDRVAGQKFPSQDKDPPLSSVLGNLSHARGFNVFQAFVVGFKKQNHMLGKSGPSEARAGMLSLPASQHIPHSSFGFLSFLST